MNLFESRYQRVVSTGSGWYAPDVQRMLVAAWRSRVARTEMTPGRIIEFGCGTGENLEALRLDGWEPLGFEISPSAVGAIETRFPAVSARVADLGDPLAPFPPPADIVLDGDCYHFQIGPRRPIYLQNVRGCLRPGGWFILSTNLYSEDLTIPNLNRDQRISYLSGVPTNYWATEPEILRELTTAGFKIHRQETVQRDFTSLVVWATFDS